MKKCLKTMVLSMSILGTVMSTNGQQANCHTPNTAFKSGESLTYKIYYNWGALWVGAGEVTFSAQLETYRNKPVYHLKGVGRTYKSYDWFYKVRDNYESYVDTATLLPYRFKRNIREGDYFLHLEYIFRHNRNRAYSVYQTNKQPIRKDTLKIPDCTYDVLSIIYYSRTIDYSKYTPGDTIPITILLDNELYNIYIHYLGKEIYETESFGKYRCIKFSPLLVAGTIFKEGNEMKVWVTDDKNKIPLLVESPIIVGSIKAKIKKCSGLRNKLTSKIR